MQRTFRRYLSLPAAKGLSRLELPSRCLMCVHHACLVTPAAYAGKAFPLLAGMAALPRRADLLQRPLHPLERCIDGSIWGGATLGDLEQCARDPDLYACYFMTFLLRKDNACFKNVFVWRIEFYESLRNPSHEMWR